MKLAEAFADLSTALINDACLRLGVAYQLAPPGLRPLAAGDRAAGGVLPVRHNGRVEVFLEALDNAHDGDVMVVDNGGRLDEGCIGDLVAIEAKTAGLAGFVIWGAFRDAKELAALEIPVFAYAVYPRGPVETRTEPPDRLEVAHFGEAKASARDVVFADGDGALFVPRASLERVLETAALIAAREREQAERVRGGTPLREQLRLDEFLERRAKEPGYTFSEHVKKLGGAIGE